jgi:N-acetylneuraminic acid mutarotase
MSDVPSSDTAAQWRPRPSLNVARGGLIDAMAGKTYAIGGFTTGFGAELDAVEELDPAHGQWRLVAPMPTARGNPAAAGARGEVYVFGGFVRDKTVDVVEVFDPRTGHWRTGRPLPGARGGAGAAAVGDRVYVIGGFDADDIATAAVTVYDTHADTWQSVRPMPSKRGLLKVAQLDGRLYAIGGRDDNQVNQSAVQRYDPVADRWHTMAPLRTARGNPGVAAAARHLFVVAGAGPDGPLRTTERYDVHADRWQTLDPLLPVGRASLSAAYVTDGDAAHGHRDLLIAVGGFTVTDGLPTASARVEALPVANA